MKISDWDADFEDLPGGELLVFTIIVRAEMTNVVGAIEKSLALLAKRLDYDLSTGILPDAIADASCFVGITRG